ncbi:MAG: hypothetical protein IT440_15705 [Phycisphaeraceae bacterium]|nr:hypothetical protein [Phycisphaeraceae bacterium]
MGKPGASRAAAANQLNLETSHRIHRDGAKGEEMKVAVTKEHCEIGEWGKGKDNPVDLALRDAGLQIKSFAQRFEKNYNVLFESENLGPYERIAISEFSIADKLGEQMWEENVKPIDFEIQVYASNSQQQPENPRLISQGIPAMPIRIL